MKAGKAPGPSGIVVEMIRAAGDMGASMIGDLAAAIIRDGKVPSDWELSFIVCFYKGKGDALEKGQLPRSQPDRPGYENPGEDCGRPHQTVGVNRRFPVWLRPRQRHYRCNLCCQAVAREVSSCQQETLHSFHRPGEGVWSSTSEGHLVGAEKTWCGGVDCATGAGDVRKCAEPYPRWWGVQRRVWNEGWCSPKISTQLAALHHCAWSLITWVPLWGPLGGPLCRWPCYRNNIIAESLEECVRRLLTWKEAMEKKRTESKCRKDKDHDLRYGTGPPAEFRRVSMRRLLDWSGKQQHLLHWLHWVHKKCSGLKRLTKDPDYRCTRCRGTARPLDGRPQKEVQVRPDSLRW